MVVVFGYCGVFGVCFGGVENTLEPSDDILIKAWHQEDENKELHLSFAVV